MSAPRAARPEVLRNIPVDRSVVIEASAGTGKTFTLEHLVVEVLLTTDVTFDRILVVTFTEKATHELRARLRAKLEELRRAADEPSGGLDGAGAAVWVLDESARRKIDHALRSFDAATITTIHAFCQRILRDNAFFSGRMFREQHVDGRDAFLRAIPEAMRREVARDPGRAPWLKTALGDGWGMDRIQDLLWRAIQSRGALRPTFDAAELRAALDRFPVDTARASDGVAEMRGWGLHPSTAKTVARRLYELAGFVERVRLGGSLPAYLLDAEGALFPYLLEKVPAIAPRPGPAATLCAAALDLARRTPSFAGGLAQVLLPPVRAELGRRKWEAGQYDFDDMLSLVDEALRGPRGPELARGMRERWRHVLIDEFQDTDETQWSIFRRGFFDRSEEAPSVLCLVGDPKQSIYRFRGADVDTYLRARAEVTGQGGGLTLLDHNYRATPDLVRATNAIFDQGAPNPFFTGSLRYAPIACGRPERTLVDGARRPVSPVHAMCLRASMPAPLSALGAWIASEVTAIVDASHPWQLDGRPLDHGDVFVLTRTSREGRIIGGALRTAGVPHTFYKQDGLFQTDEAKDIRALLGAVDEPGDRARRLAAWLTPFFGLSLPAIDRARDLPSDHPLVSRLLAWKSIADTRDFDRLFEAITLESGFVRREIFFGDGERELTNFLHLFELLLEYAHGTQSTLSDLVRTLSGLIEGTRLPLDLEGSVQRIESERDAVQIMTIHKSKGLEAPIVFVAGGSGQVRSDDVRVYHAEGHRLAWVGAISDPEVDARAKAEEHEEDQRLMYVALTRAKGRLYLPCMTADRQSGGDDGSQRESKATRGPYGVVQRRLVDLIEAGASFVTTVDVPAAPPRDPAPAGPGGWTPPATLLRPADERAMGDLRRGRLGPFVTSYTRMRGEQHAARTAPVRRPVVEPQDDAAGSELRGARTSGVFLHELLERLPLESFVDRDVDAWRSRPDVSSLFDEAMAAHRIDRAQRAHAEQLVWAAYTTPLELPGGARIDGIAATRGVVREMDFVFPVPDDGEPSRAPSARGFVRGSIDLAFENQGATYFVDWKSDSLSSYAPDALRAHVRDHYETQARLYAVAIVRLLGPETRARFEGRFGGMLYCFLRGMDENGHGIWSARPSWDEVKAWEGELCSMRERPGAMSP